MTKIISNQVFEEIITRYSSGETVSQLAGAYSISAKAIWSRFAKHGVKTKRIMRKLTEDEVDLAIQMYKDGKSYKDIATKLSTTTSNISNRLCKKGIVYEGPSRRKMLCHICKDNLTDLNFDPAFRAASNYTCRKCGTAVRFNKNRRAKLIVFNHYGGKCECCGISQIEFLSIDHINGGGTKHRRAVRLMGTNYYRWIRRNNFPKNLRILCFNCNQALGMFGYCPHKESIKYAEKKLALL